jgi:hypothetical protein
MEKIRQYRLTARRMFHSLTGFFARSVGAGRGRKLLVQKPDLITGCRFGSEGPDRHGHYYARKRLISSTGITLTRLFPFPGFLLEVSGAVFIAYGLITSRSMLVAVGAVMLGLGLLLTVFGLLLRFRRNGPEEP